MLEFFQKNHLNIGLYKERLDAFHSFFNINPKEAELSTYFTIFPDKYQIILKSAEAEQKPEEEIFSSTNLIVKIQKMQYESNKEVDIDFINARNSKVMIFEPGALINVEHLFSMKTMKGFFNKAIGEKIIRLITTHMELHKNIKCKYIKMSKKIEPTIVKSSANEELKNLDSPIISPVNKLQAVMSIDQPQFNIQNELKNSQAVLTTGGRTCILVSEKHIKEHHENYWIQKTVWGYIPSLLYYVAPTNLYKTHKTLWLDICTSDTIPRKQNLMENIMYAKENEVIINIMNPDYNLKQTPMLAVDIKINDIQLNADSANFWKFVAVLDAFIFDRGQKEKEEEEGEKLKENEINQYPKELLTNIIFQNLSKVLDTSFYFYLGK